MTKKQINENWLRVTPEFRKYARKLYNASTINKSVASLTIKSMFSQLFGLENIVSDVEPEELLFCKKSEVLWRYEEAMSALSEGSQLVPELRGFENGKATILAILFGNQCQLENISQDPGADGYINGNDTKDEAKELILGQLLKGSESEILFSPIIGECKIIDIRGEYIYVSYVNNMSYCFFLDGRREKSGLCLLYPSRTLYEKFPLDAYAAWTEWLNNKELAFYAPKSLLAPVSNYWELTIKAKFHNHDVAKQADIVVRKTIVKFHEQNIDKELTEQPETDE